jgi:membrane-associated phospholipid phosphatase
MSEKRSLSGLPKQFISKKILSVLLEDFAFFGSVPFLFTVLIFSYFSGELLLFKRIIYTTLLGFIVSLIITKIHYKDRPRKEEFSIFMEKVIASSVPSTHSMIATSLAILISLAYPFAWLISTVVVLSFLVYIQRYVAKKHYMIDIIGGILISSFMVLFIVRVF